jgi:hypothetical protein
MRRLIVLLVLLLPAVAQAQGIVLRTDRMKLTEGGRSSLEVVITGELQGSLTLPENEQVEFVQTQQSVSQSITRGRVEAQTTITYAVLAKAPGTVTVGPIRAMVSGRMRRSNQVELTVLPAAAAARAARDAPADARRADWYAIASVSDERPYVGESVTYDLERGVAVRARELAVGWPDWTPLVPEPGVEVESNERQGVVEGKRYTIVENRVALFAVEPGPIVLRPTNSSMTVLSGRRGGVFGLDFGETKRFDSNPVQLEVRPLPRGGRPDGFSGAVGRFSVRATLDANTVDAGATVTLEVRVAGLGGLRSVDLPIELPDDIKVYDADPEQRTAIVDGAVRSEAIYRKTLVPLKPGTFTIPPVAFSYFDPEEGAYRTARSQAQTLTVTGEAVMDTALLARSAGLGTGKEQVEVLGNDILPLHAAGRVLGDERLGATSPGVLALLLLPLLSFGLLFGQAAQARREGTDAGQERRRKKAAKGAAGAARQAAKDGDWQGAESALRGFLTAKLERSGDAISPGEAAAVLKEAGAPAALASSLAALLDRAEAARYGGGATSGLADALADWIDDAQGSWR